MFGDFIIKLAGAVIKLAILAIIVLAGILFVPDDFVSKVAGQASKAIDFAGGEASKMMPAVSQEFNVKFQETKADLGGVYQSLKEKFAPSIGEWIGQQISNQFAPKKTGQ